MLLFCKIINSLRDAWIIFIIIYLFIFWQIISDTDLACGKENSCLLTTGIKHNFCSSMAAFSISLHTFYLFKMVLLLIVLITFKGIVFPVRGLLVSTLLLKQCEWNFIEHSELNMACWQAVWALLSLLGLLHNVSASRLDDTWHAYEEWCNIRPNCWWLCTAWHTVKQDKCPHTVTLDFCLTVSNLVYYYRCSIWTSCIILEYLLSSVACG